MFATRLLVAVVLAVATSSAAGYFVMLNQLRHGQVARNAEIQRSDVRGLERLDRLTRGGAIETDRVDDLVAILGARPGTIEATVIDQSNRIVASGTRAKVVGSRETDPNIAAALTTGASYAGGDTDHGRDGDNFAFVSPVKLSGRHYALVVVYDHEFFDATVARVRQTVVMIDLLALFGGGLVFFLVGGRALMRSYRRALNRATCDGLTDLPNQRAFQDEFEEAVTRASRFGEPLTLIVLDVDDFKRVNDHLGHPHGDAVLGRVADVLSAGRLGDRAYRLGGDEFALLLPRADEAGARRLARRLRSSLNAAETLVSIGASTLRGGRCAEDFRAEADAALHEAKQRGGNRVTHFDEIRSTVSLTTSAKNDPVRQMIAEAGISTVYQPIWDLEAGVLLGVEALMRPDATYGLTGPEEAFDIAEQIGEVHRLDELCVRSALNLVPKIPDLALLFINLSPLTLDLDADGNDWLVDAARRAGRPTDHIVIEVTERFGGRTASVTKCLQRLRGQGFKLAIDDVGTGNSGLEMLQQVEAEFVKIDRSVVAAAISEPAARAVLMAMAAYASQTNSLVIAEGVEDHETLDFLGDIEKEALRPGRIITAGQGYGLGRPAPDIELALPDLLKPRQETLPTPT